MEQRSVLKELGASIDCVLRIDCVHVTIQQSKEAIYTVILTMGTVKEPIFTLSLLLIFLQILNFIHMNQKLAQISMFSLLN